MEMGKSSHTLKRKRMDKAEQKRAVWDAVMELLEEKSYQQTTMAAIAAQAKMSKETLYNLFPSKEELFSALIENNAEKMNVQITHALRESDIPFPEMLKNLSETFLRVLTSNPVVIVNRVAIASASTDNGFAAILQQHGRTHTMRLLIELFKNAVDEKKLKNMAPELLAEMYIMFTMGNLQLMRCLGVCPELSEDEVRQRAERAVHYFLELFA